MEDHDTELNTAVLGSPAVSTDGTENGDAALLAAGQDNGNYDVAVGDAGQEKRHSKVLKSRKKKRKKKKRKKKKRGPRRGRSTRRSCSRSPFADLWTRA